MSWPGGFRALRLSFVVEKQGLEGLLEHEAKQKLHVFVAVLAEEVSWAEIPADIRMRHAFYLPWFKLPTFGDKRTLDHTHCSSWLSFEI